MQQNNDETKNLILAAVLSMMVVFGWSMLFPGTFGPAPDSTPAEEQAADGSVPVPAQDDAQPDQAPVTALPREQALSQSGARIEIESPSITGSFLLTGGRLDDLHLTKYNVTLEDAADTVVLLNPQDAETPYFVDYGWQRTEGMDASYPLPRAQTPWTVESGDRLTPDTPVTLKWENGAGLIFRRTYALDDRYMFTVTQSVENTTGDAVSLAPFGLVSRVEGDAAPIWVSHEGATAQVDGERQYIDYSDLADLAPNPETGARRQYLKIEQNGWLGFVDKYWMTSLVGTPGSGFNGYYQVRAGQSEPLYQALLLQHAVEIPADSTITAESQLFAGAKEYYTLRDYEDALGIQDFVYAIDWGWFDFLTKPIFQLLAWINGLIGNMGWSILMLTLLIKTLLFPLAWKSYVSMSKMKKLQPEMEKIKERVGDDRQKLQQEMMALYKKEKVNPASGCLPILLQIPIFFSLYKVLFVTLEMRHAPFIGWITDLSAPDPTSILNLFGLLPFATPGPESFLYIFSIGVYPVLMGVTMWLQQKLNPAPTDPTQQMIFAWMPWVFMFMLGTFASGLVLYWVANNTITFIQQYLIMRSQGVDVDILGNIKSSFKKKQPEPEK